MTTRSRRARVLLVVTFLLFFLPIVGAWLLNVFAPHWLPFGTLNHGTLVQPARPLGDAGLALGAGGTHAPAMLTGRWTILHLPGGPCGKRCIEVLGRTGQVHKALGDDMNRVQRLLVFADPARARGIAAPTGPAIAVADGEWLKSFRFDGAAHFLPGIYLVDPQGYLMMRYPLDVEQRGLLADLERLLKISKIG